MNCRTCQYELSQCLDGRLASGRRVLVMDHVAECARCAELWRELQAAQALVVQLKRKRVGPEFREQLFARIEAGEGTPPAVFQEPVPVLAKVRYTLTGAAAAAIVLTVATLVRDKEPTLDSASNVATLSVDATPSDAPAMTTDAPRVRTGGGAPLVRRDPATAADPTSATLASAGTPAENSLFGSVRPLTPDLVAVETAREFEQRFRWTTHLLDQGDASASIVRTVRDNAAEIHSLGQVLVDLRDSKWVSFGDPKVDADLRVIVSLLGDERLQGRDSDAEIVRTRIAPVLRNNASLSQLTSTLSITPAFDRDAQMQAMARFSRQWPDVLGRIFFVLPSDPGAADFDPRDVGRTFVFQDSCGPVYVAPFREVRRLRVR